MIGAGAAGLAAARSLAAASLRVLVLEARDRVGGRVWPVPSPGAGMPAELGAEFIHGRAPETKALLRDAGQAAVDIGAETWIRGDGGKFCRTDQDFVSAAGIFEGTRALATDESVERFLRRFDGDDAVRDTVELARAFVEGFDAADPAIASAQAIAEEWRSGVDFASTRPVGGYGPIFERLRNGCAAAGVQIRFSTIVRKISWGRGAVAVETTSPRGEARTVHARAAIVTLPVGVLQHRGDETGVVFEPALPATKHAALEKLVMGQAVRVALWFRTPFWERVHDGRYRDGAFFRCLDQPFPTYWTQLPVRSGLMVAWVAGPKASALNGASPSEVVGQALDGLGASFGDPELVRGEFEAGLTHLWGCDPFARGAYSYVAVGGANARADFAAPIDDVLFFAGEAASNDGQGGTVNGALETGVRAARAAAASFGRTAA